MSSKQPSQTGGNWIILSQYCFIRDKSQLSEPIVPPEPLAQSILLFHQLSPKEKHQVLSNLGKLMKNPQLVRGQNVPKAIQQWFQSIPRSTQEALAQYALWLSRYCAYPEKTVTEVNAVLGKTADAIDLSEYCFIQSRSPLNSQQQLPSPKIARILLSFHELSAPEKQTVLPTLKKLFVSPRFATIEGFHEGIQRWLRMLAVSEPEDLRQAKIWFSRYCFNPEKTIVEIETGKPAPAEEDFQTPMATQREERERVEAPDSDATPASVGYPSGAAATLPIKRRPSIRLTAVQRKLQSSLLGIEYIPISWSEFTKNLPTFLIFTLIDGLSSFTILSIISFISALTLFETNPDFVYTKIMLISFLYLILGFFHLLVLIAISEVIDRSVRGKSSNAVTVLGNAFANLLPVLCTNTKAFFICLLYTLLLIIPGIWKGVRLSFASYAVILRQDSQVSPITYSESLVTQRWWHLVVRYALAGLLMEMLFRLANVAVVFISVMGLGAAVPLISPLVVSLILCYMWALYTLLFLNFDYTRQLPQGRVLSIHDLPS